MTEFGKTIRPDIPPSTPAEKHYAELIKPGADEKFAAEFPIENVPQMISDNEMEDEMEGIESIRSQAEYRKQYLTGALEIINYLLESRTFKHSSTLQEMYNYFEQASLKLKDQALAAETRAKDTNTVFALRSLLELLQEDYPPTLDYIKVWKILNAKLKDIRTTLQQPEL